MKKTVSVLFVLFITIMGILIVPASNKKYSVNEKRYYASFPDFSFASLEDGSFSENLNAFFIDHVPFRDFFMGLNSYKELILFLNGASDVYYSKDGYLISAPAGNKDIFNKNISKFEDFSASLSIPSSIIIIPGCGYIMENKLPLIHKEFEDEKLLQNAKNTLKSVNFIDVSQVLKDASTTSPVFYKTDHHLTSFGNFAIYSSLYEAEALDYKIESHDGFYGTTRSQSGFWLTKADKIELWDDGGSYKVTIEDPGKDKKVQNGLFFKQHLNEADKYPVFLDGNHPLTRIENTKGGEKNLLIIKDSYAHSLAPFLAKNYKNIYMIDMRYYRLSVKQFIKENNIDELLYVYGSSTLLTDTNSSWLR